MKSTIITTLMLAAFINLGAQNARYQVLSEIVNNNTRLQALEKELEARGLEQRTGLWPADPEAEYAYLWGSPAVMGNRVNISLIQSFDFPTTYIYGSRIADARDGQLALEYERELTELLYEAGLIITELVYRNARAAVYEERLAHAREIRDSYRAKLEQGEAGMPEYNKSALNLLNISKEAEINTIGREKLLSELASLNGGREIAFSHSEYHREEIPENFDRWYSTAEQDNPVLRWLSAETEVRRMEVSLNRAQGLPSFHAGYMSATVGAEQFRGITAGITIPLWENRHRVSSARARTDAMESMEADNRLMFYHRLKSAHAKALSLRESVEEYRRLLQTYDNTLLLKEALERGEISLIEYILELTIYYNSRDRLMEAELEMHRAIADLYRYSFIGGQ